MAGFPDRPCPLLCERKCPFYRATTPASGLLGREVAFKFIDRIGAQQVVGLSRSPSEAMDPKSDVRAGDYD